MRENQSNTKAKEPEGQRPANFSLYHRISNAKCARMVIVQDSATQTDLSVLGKKANYSAMLKSLVVKAFLGYFILCVLLICSSFFQSLFVYLNVIRWPLTNSELTDLNSLGIPNARNIVLQTQDGYKIRGYHLIPISRLNTNISFDDSYFDTHLATAKRIVIYFHGNGLTRGLHRRISIIKQISNFLDADVITFDYRGFGDSEGWPSENGINEDSLAIFKWIDRIISENSQEKSVFLTSTERVPSVPKLYFYGQSLGTGVATAAVSKLNSNLQKLSNIGVNGLILDSPFTTLLDAARTHPVASVFRLFPFVEGLMRWALRFHYPIIDQISLLKVPILIVHGTLDYKVPISNSYKIMEKAVRSGNFVEFDYRSLDRDGKEDTPFTIQVQMIPGAKHDNTFQYIEWLQSLSNFIRYVES